MKKMIVFVVSVLFIAVFVFNNKLFYPPLPMENLSKKEAVELLNDSNKEIVKLASENGYEWYITRSAQSIADENIKKMLSQNGWLFKQKDGSGLFFEKQGDRLIATTQRWTGDYVLVKIPVTFNK
ncbi:hypothetical protein [Bacillus cihuensis]|uniref:hypothetical protein n=1 Tax=Bacillus cihuensis TaxID=1208599 RepID=UPI0003F5A2B9|nr:hypothetical protein [Bacillus cihuensis]